MSFEFNEKIIGTKPEEVGKEMGKAVAEGVGVGLDENSYRAITAVEKVYVELETVTKNAEKNAQNLAKKQQKRQLANLENALKLGLVTEQEYYEKLKIFRDENLRQGTDAWFKCTEEIAKYNKKVLEDAEEEQQQLIKKLEKLKEQLVEKFKGKDEWFNSSKVRFIGLGENGTDLVYNDTTLKNFREEITLLENYRDRIAELQKLGNVPDGVFLDIGALSVEKGMAAMDAILLASGEERKKFFDGYNAFGSTANSLATELLGVFYSGEGGQISKDLLSSFSTGAYHTAQSGEFEQILKSHFDTVPESYLELGKSAGKNFGDGFVAEIPLLMERLKNQFTVLIEDIGKQISATVGMASQVAAGVTNMYSSTYNFNSSKDTTTQQLAAARSAATLERLRGGIG